MDKNNKKSEQEIEEKVIEDIDDEKDTKNSKPGTSVEELEKKIQELEEKNSELDNNWKRAVADYRNLEKRSHEERIETIKFASGELLKKLLPAFDTLFLAEKYTKDQGVALTIKHILDILKQEGITRIEVVGKKFDATSMEAVTTGEGEEDIILEELRPGYIIEGKLIRPAQVKVGKGN